MPFLRQKDVLTDRYPDFLIIGAQKSGTSSLFHLLSQHPDLLLPKGKEVHFFDLKYEKGMTWYARFFPDRQQLGTRLTGEATPYYFFHPCVPERVALHLPNVKLIVLLRNPVNRAYSHYAMERNRNNEPVESFPEAIRLESARIAGEEEKLIAGTITQSWAHRTFTYAARGMYGRQFERWLKYFPIRQFHIITSDEFFENPQNELNKVYKFLNIREILPTDYTPQKQGSYPGLSQETVNDLNPLFAEDAKLLKSIIGDKFTWDK
jgi:hypothetical protein